MKSVKIGNAQGFWGDNPEAPKNLVKSMPTLDYLTLDYLAEISLSIMASQREKNREWGFALDFLSVVRDLSEEWKKGSSLKVVTNAGGLNPMSCAKACKEALLHTIHRPFKIGVVTGDDVLPEILKEPSFPLFKNLDTYEELSPLINRIKSANAYLGAFPIVECLKRGADIVITGRVADPSLTLGPSWAFHGWKETDLDYLAQATVAGHLIECGTQVTGGISSHWQEIKCKFNLGFPYVEIFPDGSFIISKPDGTGGIVNEETVKEQLLYEIGDPDQYLSPDVRVSILRLKLDNVHPNQVKITGAKGFEPPSTYKVSLSWMAGYKAEGSVALFCPEAKLKAKQAGEMIFDHLKREGITYDDFLIEEIGSDEECMLRLAVLDKREESVERFTKEIASLVASGPQGVTGYSSGRPSVRKAFGFWPCLIEKNRVLSKIEMLEF